MYLRRQLLYSIGAMENQNNHSDDDNPLIPPERRSSLNHRPALIKVLRARTRFIVCVWTLPVYIVAVWLLLNNRQNIETFMFIYMAIWTGFAVDMAGRRCPACGKQFYIKNIFLNFRTRQCVHCGLDMAATGSPGDDKVEF